MKKIEAGILIISCIAYIIINYLTPRENFYQLFTIYTLLFLGYIYLSKPFQRAEVHIDKQISQENSPKYKLLFSAGLLFRIVLLFSIPNLSDDFYRFYWDGLLNANGISPFAHLPVHLIDGTIQHSIESINQNLYSKLNSPNYYSIYPPVCQVISFIAATIFPKSIIGACFILKIFMLLFEVSTFFFLKKLLHTFSYVPTLIFVYWLNPLVIIELVGNIHFEAGMVCLTLGSLYYLSQSNFLGDYKFPYIKSILNKEKIAKEERFFDKNLFFAAICLSLAVSTKLIPLIFLPFLLKRIGLLRTVLFGGITIILFVICFSPFINFQLVSNLMNSVELYFAKFEFNASIYYIARWIGFQIKGWNMIVFIGSIFSKIVFITIMLMALFEKNPDTQKLPIKWHQALWVYLLFATIVHPWYIIPLIALSIFTKSRISILWSFLIMLSYFTYISNLYVENLYLVIVEYLLLLLYLIFEIVNSKRSLLLKKT